MESITKLSGARAGSAPDKLSTNSPQLSLEGFISFSNS